ncbi:MAG: cytochrome c oxidase subunit II [Gammaproteobacteria bacterium]
MARLKLNQSAAWLAGLLSPLMAGSAAALPASNMPKGVTEISHQVYGLHMLIFWICVGIGVLVFGAMLYSVIRHRRSKGYKAAQFHESTTVEILWTIVPFVILVAMAIPATQTLIAMEDTGNSDMTIKITGYQWKWHYDYLDQNVDFFSTLSTPRSQIFNQAEKGEHYLLEVDNEVVVPVDKKIRLLLTSNDVIHAWWVPELAVKKDAIPGFINQMWTQIDEPGVYRGQCAELCGRDHGFMPVVVRAVEQAEFDKWVQAQKGGKQGGQKLTQASP